MFWFRRKEPVVQEPVPETILSKLLDQLIEQIKNDEIKWVLWEDDYMLCIHYSDNKRIIINYKKSDYGLSMPELNSIVFTRKPTLLCEPDVTLQRIDIDENSYVKLLRLYNLADRKRLNEADKVIAEFLK